MVSEGSWNAEDWRNDAKKSAFFVRNKLILKVY